MNAIRRNQRIAQVYLARRNKARLARKLHNLPDSEIEVVLGLGLNNYVIANNQQARNGSRGMSAQELSEKSGVSYQLVLHAARRLSKKDLARKISFPNHTTASLHPEYVLTKAGYACFFSIIDTIANGRKEEAKH